MAFSSGIYRRLHFGINIENDRSESVSGSNSPEISENVLDDAISQSSKGKRKLQYRLEVSTHLPRRSRVYYSQLSLGIPAACGFFTEKNLRSGSKVAAGKFT